MRSEGTVSGKMAGLELSNPDKVLFPEDGITKGDLVAYYRDIAEVMLPHIRNRPVSMLRYPDGIQGPRFYQKEAPDYFPDWIQTVRVPKEPSPQDPDTTQCQVICTQPETLAYLAAQACITPHTWLSREPKLRRPDRMVFDLDPSGEDFDFNQVKDGARRLKQLLEAASLPAFLMTTGSRGLHVVVPLRPELDFDEVRPVARRFAERLAQEDPERFTTEIRKKERQGRIFIDYLRNGYAQTAVPPYAVRPKPGAPVATPLHWPELDDPSLQSQSYTLRTILRRLEKGGDPWGRIQEDAVSALHLQKA